MSRREKIEEQRNPTPLKKAERKVGRERERARVVVCARARAREERERVRREERGERRERGERAYSSSSFPLEERERGQLRSLRGSSEAGRRAVAPPPPPFDISSSIRPITLLYHHPSSPHHSPLPLLLFFSNSSGKKEQKKSSWCIGFWYGSQIRASCFGFGSSSPFFVCPPGIQFPFRRANSFDFDLFFVAGGCCRCGILGLFLIRAETDSVTVRGFRRAVLNPPGVP
jgi:hypothetical protein